MRIGVASALTTLTLTLANAQPSANNKRSEGVPHFDDDCRTRVVAIIKDQKAIHDGPHKPGLPSVPLARAKQVVQHGLPRGLLSVESHISPHSRYSVVQYADGAPLKEPELCPLDQTYLVFTQGGFQQQRAVVFGPLR